MNRSVLLEAVGGRRRRVDARPRRRLPAGARAQGGLRHVRSRPGRRRRSPSSGTTVVASYAVGVVVTVVAALPPGAACLAGSRRSQALRDDVAMPERRCARRLAGRRAARRPRRGRDGRRAPRHRRRVLLCLIGLGMLAVLIGVALLSPARRPVRCSRCSPCSAGPFGTRRDGWRRENSPAQPPADRGDGERAHDRAGADGDDVDPRQLRLREHRRRRRRRR